MGIAAQPQPIAVRVAQLGADNGRPNREIHVKQSANPSAGTNPASRAWVVAPRGDLDICSADQLNDELGAIIDRGASMVVLDLADVHFLDSTGLRVILRRARELEERGGRLLLEHMSAATERVLEITGTLEHLREAPTHA